MRRDGECFDYWLLSLGTPFSSRSMARGSERKQPANIHTQIQENSTRKRWKSSRPHFRYRIISFEIDKTETGAVAEMCSGAREESGWCLWNPIGWEWIWRAGHSSGQDRIDVDFRPRHQAKFSSQAQKATIYNTSYHASVEQSKVSLEIRKNLGDMHA